MCVYIYIKYGGFFYIAIEFHPFRYWSTVILKRKNIPPEITVSNEESVHIL